MTSNESNINIKKRRNKDFVMEKDYENSFSFEERKDFSSTCTQSEETDWVCKLFNVNGSDLQVVAMGSFNSKKVALGNGQQVSKNKNDSNGNTSAEEIPAHGDQCEQEVDEGIQNGKTRSKQCEAELSKKTLNQDNNRDTREQEDIGIQNGCNKYKTAEEIPAYGDQCEQEVDEGIQNGKTRGKQSEAEPPSNKAFNQDNNHDTRDQDIEIKNGCNKSTTAEKIPVNSGQCEQEVDNGIQNGKTEVEISNKSLNLDNNHDIREQEDAGIKNSNKNTTAERIPAHGNHCEQEVREGISKRELNIDGKQYSKPDKVVKKPTCSFCQKTFASICNLKTHERIHTGVKPYTCTYCNKAFTQQGHLSAHEPIHTGVKPYKCKHCNRAFTDRSTCVKHERIHTGNNKPYQCKHCDRKFSAKCYLIAHDRLHTAQPYECKHCDKTFLKQKDLKTHRLSHTDMKIHICKHCNKAFMERVALKRHERRLHMDVQPYKCKECDKTFSRLHYLELHQHIHTGVKTRRQRACTKDIKRRLRKTK